MHFRHEMTVRHSDLHGDVYVAPQKVIQISHSELIGRATRALGAKTSCFVTCGPSMTELDAGCEPISQ